MWKILASIAGVALIAAAVLGYQNRTAYIDEIDARLAAEKQLADTETQLAMTEEELKKTEDDLAGVQQRIVELDTELKEIEVATSEQEKIEGEMSDKLDAIIVEVAKMQDLMENVEKIEDLQQEMADLTTRLQDLDDQTLSAQNAITLAEQRRENVQNRVESYLALERDQRNGVIRGGLSASVRSADNEWGFVVINAGDGRGVVPLAELAVARQGMQICRLVVTSVEPGTAVATIVPETLAPGQQVQAGDRVVVVPKMTVDS